MKTLLALSFLLCGFLPFGASQDVPVNTSTLSLPPGYSNHDDPNLICRPTKWSDIAIFFIGNYVAHAATVKTLPGESPLGVILNIAFALLFPTSGVTRSVMAMW